MNLERQVCTLQQSKRLRELGAPNNVHDAGVFIWITAYKEDGSLCFARSDRDYMHISPSDMFRAFTVAELGEMLQNGETGIPINEGEIDSKSDVFVTVSIETWITPNLFNCAIVNKEFPDRVYKEYKSRNEAEARAAMLIYLIENGFNPIPNPLKFKL